MTDVFISYARADRDKVRLIAHGLTAEGFSVWWDPDIKPGKKWNAVIRRALDGAGAVVTCWTPASAKSDWVLAETTHGHGKQALVPAMLKRCTPPIPYNMVQTVDLTRWRGSGDDPNWLELLRRVRELVEAKRRMIAAAPPPGEAEAAPASYTPSVARGRMGPRFSQLAVGAVAAGAVLTAGLWSFANLPTLFAPPAPPYVEEASQEAALIETSAPEPPPGADTPIEPAPIEDTPPDLAGEPVEPDPARPPAHAPDPVRITAALDSCAQRLAQSCAARRSGQPMGFAADGRLSVQESDFLRTAGAPVAPTEAAIESCRMLIAAPQSTAVQRACRGLEWPAEPAPPTADPRPAEPQAPNWQDFFSSLLERIQRAPERPSAAPTPAPAPSTPPASPGVTATRPPSAISRQDSIAVDRGVREEPQQPVVR